MTGPCLCGDIYCASCGNPGQADIETACDWIYEVLLVDMHPSINIDWWSEELVTRLGKYQEIADAILLVAKRHAREDTRRRWKNESTSHPLVDEVLKIFKASKITEV